MKKRDALGFGWQRENTVGLGKNHHAKDTALDVVGFFKATDKLIGGSHRAFQLFVNSTLLVLIELIAVHADLALPVFDLQNKGRALVDYQKILFQEQILVRNHHVADHAVKMLTQDPINGFLTVGAKALDLFGFGKSRARKTVQCCFDGVRHKKSPHVRQNNKKYDPMIY